MAQPKRAAQPVDLDSRRDRKGRPILVATKGPLVKQRDLQEIVARRQEVATLKARLAEAEKLVTEAETSVRMAFSIEGVMVEPGDLTAAIKVTQARYPHWKDLFIQRCGKEAADLAVANTTPTVKRELVITGPGPISA